MAHPNFNKMKTKFVAGVAGLKCGCCRAFGSVKRCRVGHNRTVRHAMKIEDARVLRDADAF